MSDWVQLKLNWVHCGSLLASTTVQLATNNQLEAKAEARKLKELRLEDMLFSATLLVSELADKQDSKLETFACHFTNPGRCKILWIQVQAVVTKPDWEAKGIIPGK